MGRLKEDFLQRVDAFAHRVVDVADVLRDDGRSHRIEDQMIGSGTSIGANIAEADEAMSRPDFCKCLSIAFKELAETRYWIRFVATRGWIRPHRLTELDAEAVELKRILGSILTKSKKPRRP
ncbi:MAG: four helix bundle protein [Phycisphaerales bacterium]|nr:four helix bundle protein [Phycisphaerales bacterium]